MATNIDKSLYQAPLGLDSIVPADEPDIEIEIENPDAASISADGMEIDLLPVAAGEDVPFDANLAEHMDPTKIGTVATDLIADIDNDKRGRSEWEKTYREGLKLLGLQYEERMEPWNGACGVFHPMITEAVVRFQAEMITETFPAQGPVKTKIIGRETPEVVEAAARVQADMNFALTETMKEYRPEHERMLWSLPAAGSAFKKVYFDPSLGRQVSVFVPAEDILLPYGTTDLDTCHRVTHVMRKTKNDILKLQVAGFYRDVELGEPSRNIDELRKAKDKETGFSDLNDDMFTLLESHVDLDLPGFEDPDGIARPYVVTVLKETNEILSIRRNWLDGDELKIKRQHFVHYQYIPGFGAYGFGLFHLIGGFAKSATSIMRQLVDAGTLSNLPGGLKSRGLRIKGDDTPIAPGEFRDVDISGGSIKDNILPLPYKEPSNVLYQLLGNIVDEGRRFAATADMQISDMSAQAPVGTTLALIERQLKVLTAVQSRTHFTLKQEFKLLKSIIRDHTAQTYEYEPAQGSPQAKQGDYDLVDVIPVSDPNAATMSQRVVQYQAVIQMAQMAPDIYDLPQLHRAMLDVLGIKNADKLVPLPDDKTPVDPVTENQHILTGTPVKAFLSQDHDAHMAVHNMMLQDPMVAAQMGQNPQAQAIAAALHAHIAEHLGYKMRKAVEARMGVPLPPPDEPLPPAQEAALSSLMAQAMAQVVAQNQAQAKQQQAQQQMQDPLVQMQMQELQIKAQEAQIKAMKAQTEAQDAERRAQLEMAKIQEESRKNRANEEIQESKVRAQVLHTGVMGRAQDQQLLQKDRELAQRALLELQRSQQQDNSGFSGDKKGTS
jgi:hypothetical protein